MYTVIEIVNGSEVPQVSMVVQQVVVTGVERTAAQERAVAFFLK